MFFHSLSSLFIFLPIVFIIFPLIKKFNYQYANVFLLIFSLVFYAFDIPWFVIPLLISSFSDYFISSKLINQNNLGKNIRIYLLITSFLINIGLLVTFKYSLLISNTLNLKTTTSFINMIDSLILPAGISFYTFQTLSFSIDSFKKKIKKMPSFNDYFLYVSYFPQLVAGPILRPEEFFDRNSKPILNQNLNLIKNGFSRLCYGLFIKLCIADELARFNDIAFLADYNMLGFLDAWTMAFGFGLQIYFDFSAYSHIAIGISRIIGLPIKENFIFPYSSNSVTEFWRRWHISLSTWVSDYLYNFLNRKLSPFFYGVIPLIITWSIMGIWHGASWRFAFWGLLNGILVLIHRIFKNNDFIKDKFKKLDLISNLITLYAIMSTWIYFRSTSWEQANTLYKKLFNFQNFNLGLAENYYLVVTIFLLVTLFAGYLDKSKFSEIIKNNRILQILASSISIVLSLIFISNQNAFIYFQF